MSKCYENPERKIFDKQTEEFFEKKISENKKIKAKTKGQFNFLETIEECTYTLCGGVAGTGKTFLSLGKGVEYLKAGKYKKVLLIRPTQECGRPLGFFPGEKSDKLKPHMLAFTDLFGKFLSPTEIIQYTKDEKIVVDTCEYMRGTTWDDMFVVVDEAQNCTLTQLKMLLTRVGQNTKLVIVGDEKQTDLWRKEDLIGSRCPFAYVMDALEDEDDDIGVVELTEEDIVRNGLIGKILKLLDSQNIPR